MTILAVIYMVLAAVGTMFGARMARAAYLKSRELNLGSSGRAPILNELGGNISIVKPVYRMNEFTEACFRSWLVQAKALGAEVIFSLQSELDPARTVLAGLRSEFSFVELVNPVKAEFSGKSSNLFFGIQAAHGEILILSDSDIEAPPGTLETLARMVRGGADFVSCLPIHRRAENIWASCYQLVWNGALMLFWAPMMIRRKAFGLAGGTIATRREAWVRAGGIEGIKDYLAEDLELGRRVRAAGLEAQLGPVVYSPVGSVSFMELIHKLMRANLAAIHQNPKGKVSTFLTYCLGYSHVPLLLIWGCGLAFGWADPFGVLAQMAIAITAVRAGSVFHLVKLSQNSVGSAFCFIIADILLWATLLIALVRPQLVWGGIRFNVENRGILRRK